MKTIARRCLYCLVPALFVALLVLVTGCGSSKNGQAAPTAGPVSVTMTANPASIAPGASSTLTITASNANSVAISGSDGTSYTLPGAGGTQAVSPSKTTTYTATASGGGGSTATATATVTVTTSAPTVTITANPTSITAGASSVLTVVATNATSVTITGTDNTSYTLQGVGGQQAVTPTATTTYTATATGPGGTASATAQVTVTQAVAPTISMTASPASITPGGSSTLTVTANHATGVTITGSDGTKYTLPGAGGTQTVSPSKTTTYTATASGAGGTATATATVTVTTAPPTVSISANPTTITAGNSSVLTVVATNATTVTITGSDSSSYTLQAAGGGQTVTPKTTTTYTATATGPGGTASAMVQVIVNPAVKPTVTITANPTSINAGQSSTITVTATNATGVTLSGTDGTTYTLQATGGTQVVSPTKTTSYQATATGPGGTAMQSVTVTVTQVGPPTLTITANPASIVSGQSSILTVTASNATQVSISGSDGSSYTLQPSGGTQKVSPTSNTTYTATATGPGGTTKATATVSVVASGSVNSINHVIFMLQENHSFDNYFGMLNQYRAKNGWTIAADGKTYSVDGLDHPLANISNPDDEGQNFTPFKFTSACIDDLSSAWLESYGDVNRYDFSTTRSIDMNGYVHIAEGFDKSCAASNSCSGTFTDSTGARSMGYYDDSFLNYYYYMASQFALSDRWFSPVSSKTIDNRLAMMTGGTTQGLTKDPGSNDHLPQLSIETIFQELDQAGVSWKIYYTVTQASCPTEEECSGGANALFPAVEFGSFTYSVKYLYENSQGGPCTAPTQPSSVVGDSTNSFCIDPTHIAPLNDSTYGFFADLSKSALPSFAMIEPGYGLNDEHPGSGQSILTGQAEVAKILNAFMTSPEWSSSVFFFSFDEGGGPFDHVPPVPGHSNDFTDPSAVSQYPDISSIAINPDSYNPCLPPGSTATTHCDLLSDEPGAVSTDAAANPNNVPSGRGFSAQLGFRVPNFVVSPFVRKHYVSHIPMDHTAVIKFVEDRFIGPSAHLTARDAAQPNLLDFFDFTNVPWATPPSPPAPVSSLPCNPTSYGP